MDSSTLLATRVSAVGLTNPPPSDQVIDAILRAAMRAPDHGRLKPWRFLIIRDSALKDLGDVLAGALRARDPAASQAAVDREAAKAVRAPLIVTVIASPKEHPSIPRIEQVLAAGAAAQNIMLAAFAQGVGAQWKTGAPAYDPHVMRALGLSDGEAIIGFMYLGTPTGQGRPPADYDLSSFVTEWTAHGPDAGNVD